MCSLKGGKKERKKNKENHNESSNGTSPFTYNLLGLNFSHRCFLSGFIVGSPPIFHFIFSILRSLFLITFFLIQLGEKKKKNCLVYIICFGVNSGGPWLTRTSQSNPLISFILITFEYDLGIKS
jgi:hypothetical protein